MRRDHTEYVGAILIAFGIAALFFAVLLEVLARETTAEIVLVGAVLAGALGAAILFVNRTAWSLGGDPRNPKQSS